MRRRGNRNLVRGAYGPFRRKPPKGNPSTGAWLAIGAGIVIVGGVAVYMMTRPAQAAQLPPAQQPPPAQPAQAPASALVSPPVQAPAPPATTYLLQPTIQAGGANAQTVGMRIGETVLVEPIKPDAQAAFSLSLVPPPSSGPLNMPPSLQDNGGNVYQAIATGTQVIHIQLGSAQSFGPGQSGFVADRGPWTYDITVVVT